MGGSRSAALRKPAADGLVGVAAGELLPVAANPVEQPARVVDAGVGAHQVEHRPGMLDQSSRPAGSRRRGCRR
jgi:hypothetical protein